jgi:hypothetical protein
LLRRDVDKLEFQTGRVCQNTVEVSRLQASNENNSPGEGDREKAAEKVSVFVDAGVESAGGIEFVL